MPVYVVSDLHGAAADLAAALAGRGPLVLLGDLVNLLDYRTRTGILYDVFSHGAVEQVSALRARGRFDEARRVIRERARGRGPEVREEISALARAQCEEVFAALPDPTYLILGNVDSPAVVDELCAEHPHVHHVDGEVVDIEGETFGFVGGALPTPLGASGEISPEALAAKIAGVGAVDVLCSHVPPAVPELCYDTVAGRIETGSEALLEHILATQPRCAYFGHVHQPLLSSLYVGATLCLNVGYFRATRRPWVHHREDRTDGGEEPWQRP